MRNVQFLLMLPIVGTASLLPAIAEADDNFDFAAHPVATIYQGKLNLPDFEGRHKDFALFKTRIVDGMKKGVTFAGEHSVTQFGCGTGCSQVVIANNRTGQLYGFPRGGEFNQALTLEYEVDSNLMLARWFTDSMWETCLIESFEFKGGHWIAQEALVGSGQASCEGGIAAGAKKARDF